MIVWLLGACTLGGREPYASPEDAETEWIKDIQVSLAPEMATMLEVSFRSTEAGRGWVELDGNPSPAGAAGTEHSALVLGAASLSTANLHAVVEIDGEEHRSELFTFETGNLSGAPIVDVTVNNYDAAPQATLLMMMYDAEGDSKVVMMGLDGTVFWSLSTGADGWSLGVLPEDGQIAFNHFLNIDEGNPNEIPAWISRVSLRGEELERIDTPNAHHFFTEDGDGELSWMVADQRQVDGFGEVVGDRVVSESGEELFNAWDHLTVARLPGIPVDDLFDWTHGNWHHYDPGRDSYVFSGGGNSVVVEYDASGEVLDIINGRDAVDGDYTYTGGEPFFSQHGVHWADNGDLLMFAADDDESVRAVRYALDREARTIEEVWSFGEGSERPVALLGEVIELSDGNYLVGWGAWGILQIVSPAGEVLWEGLTDFQQFVAQAHLLESPYL